MLWINMSMYNFTLFNLLEIITCACNENEYVLSIILMCYLKS